MNKKLIALTLLTFVAEQGSVLAYGTYAEEAVIAPAADCCPQPQPVCCPKPVYRNRICRPRTICCPKPRPVCRPRCYQQRACCWTPRRCMGIYRRQAQCCWTPRQGCCRPVCRPKRVCCPKPIVCRPKPVCCPRVRCCRPKPVCCPAPLPACPPQPCVEAAPVCEVQPSCPSCPIAGSGIAGAEDAHMYADQETAQQVQDQRINRADADTSEDAALNEDDFETFADEDTQKAGTYKK